MQAGADVASEPRNVWATTARQLLSAEQIATQPQIGDLFEFHVEVPGVPCPLVRY
jgi:hypothetical protein